MRSENRIKVYLLLLVAVVVAAFIAGLLLPPEHEPAYRTCRTVPLPTGTVIVPLTLCEPLSPTPTVAAATAAVFIATVVLVTLMARDIINLYIQRVEQAFQASLEGDEA